MNTADFDYVRKFVRDQAAIVLEPGKEYLVESRLLILARKEKIASIDELIKKLRSDPKNGLHRKVVDAMTTNETSFFRDIHPFEALRKSIIPELMARRAAQRQVNFWCGAASTGQEPYSVLMLIAEHFPELLKWDVKFIATDLCSEVLARSRAGCFSQLEVNRGLPASLLVKYFVRQGASWEIREDLRRRVEFREMNLVKDWPALPPLDIVFLRNVLIYFDVETKKTILAKARRLLRPGSYLLLGGAETTFNIDDAFEREVIDKTICYRVKQA
ncbi:MAG: protein-glutamate O-methyltransferase CheR [Verrucomicrobiota bacterium]